MSSKSTLDKNKLYLAMHSICEQLIRIAPNLDDKGEKPLLEAFNSLIDKMYQNNIKPSQILNEKGEIVEDATSNQVKQSKVQEGTKEADAEMDMFEFINAEIQDLNRSVIEKQGYLNYALISKEWNQHLSGDFNNHHRIWNILMFQSWLETES